MNHGHEKEKEVPVKGIDNIFNKITENFSNLKKEMIIQVMGDF
jgi:hypothetical protein